MEIITELEETEDQYDNSMDNDDILDNNENMSSPETESQMEEVIIEKKNLTKRQKVKKGESPEEVCKNLNINQNVCSIE